MHISFARHARIACLAAGLALAAPAAAQQDPASAAAPGRVFPLGSEVRDRRLSKADGAAVIAKVDKLLGRLLATPALADPHGFSINRHITVDSLEPGMPAWHPAAAEASILLKAINLNNGSTRDAATGTYGGVGEGPAIRIRVNDLTALYPWPGADDDRPTFYYLTTKPDDRGGFPMLKFRSREHVIIAKPGRLPFRHVTKQAYLERAIADERAGIAKFGGEPVPGLEKGLADKLAELAALSPTERAAPACEGSELQRGTSFTPCNEPGANYIVTVNPDYFDRSLPKTAIQLVSVSVPQEGGVGHKVLQPIVRAAVAALDLDAIRQTLE